MKIAPTVLSRGGNHNLINYGVGRDVSFLDLKKPANRITGDSENYLSIIDRIKKLSIDNFFQIIIFSRRRLTMLMHTIGFFGHGELGIIGSVIYMRIIYKRFWIIEPSFPKLLNVALNFS